MRYFQRINLLMIAMALFLLPNIAFGNKGMGMGADIDPVAWNTPAAIAERAAQASIEKQNSAAWQQVINQAVQNQKAGTSSSDVFSASSVTGTTFSYDSKGSYFSVSADSNIWDRVRPGGDLSSSVSTGAEKASSTANDSNLGLQSRSIQGLEAGYDSGSPSNTNSPTEKLLSGKPLQSLSTEEVVTLLKKKAQGENDVANQMIIKRFLAAKRAEEVAKEMKKTIKQFSPSQPDGATSDQVWKDVTRLIYYSNLIQAEKVKLRSSAGMDFATFTDTKTITKMVLGPDAKVPENKKPSGGASTVAKCTKEDIARGAKCIESEEEPKIAGGQQSEEMEKLLPKNQNDWVVVQENQQKGVNSVNDFFAKLSNPTNLLNVNVNLGKAGTANIGLSSDGTISGGVNVNQNITNNTWANQMTGLFSSENLNRVLSSQQSTPPSSVQVAGCSSKAGLKCVDLPIENELGL